MKLKVVKWSLALIFLGIMFGFVLPFLMSAKSSIAVMVALGCMFGLGLYVVLQVVGKFEKKENDNV